LKSWSYLVQAFYGCPRKTVDQSSVSLGDSHERSH